jgi:hypothetical protein
MACGWCRRGHRNVLMPAPQAIVGSYMRGRLAPATKCGARYPHSAPVHHSLIGAGKTYSKGKARCRYRAASCAPHATCGDTDNKRHTPAGVVNRAGAAQQAAPPYDTLPCVMGWPKSQESELGLPGTANRRHGTGRNTQ